MMTFIVLFLMCCHQEKLDDILQSVIDHKGGASGQQLCPEAAEILMELVKVIMTLVRMLSLGFLIATIMKRKAIRLSTLLIP